MNHIKKDRFYLAFLLGIIFIRYFQTIVLSKPISKIFLAAHWDSIFYSLRAGQKYGMDSSLVQLNIPYRFFVAQCWRHGVPLWNSLSGFGMPLLADPQTFVLSIYNALLIAFPDLHTWNLILILQLTVGTISAYLFCRELQVNATAALIAALLFTFCPWMQWNLELYGKGCGLTPFVLLFFTRMAKRQSFWSIALAGIAAAIDILAAHPEIAFVTITFSCLFTYLTAYYNNPTKFNFLSLSAKLLLAGLITFGITSPMLLPFIEYMGNGETYKLGSAKPTGITWQALFAHYIYPFYAKGSLYLGPLPILGLPTFLFLFNKRNQFNQLFLLSLVITALAVTHLFPFSLLFKIPPFSLVYPTYCLPEYILFLSIISGLGITWLLDTRLNINQNKEKLIGLVISITLLALPLTFKSDLAIHFDKMIDWPDFNFRQWLIQIIWAAGMLTAFSLTLSKKQVIKYVGSFAFIFLGILNLLLISAKSAPIEAKFQYPQSFPLPLPNTKETRILSVGDHLFKPNTNLVYGLPLIQVMNPLFPKNYIAFIQACGASFDGFTPVFSSLINPLVDLGGAKLIISEQPVLDEAAITSSPYTHPENIEAKFTNTLSLSKIFLFYDTKENNLFCQITANSPEAQINNYYLCCSILDSENRPISYIEPQFIPGSTHDQKILFSTPLPKNLKSWHIVLRLISDHTWQIIKPTNISSGFISSDGSWSIAVSQQEHLVKQVDNTRFKLLSRNGSILVYENRSALNKYFFAQQIQYLPKNKILPYMLKHTNIFRHTAIFNQSEKENLASFCQKELNIKESNFVFAKTGQIKKIDIHSLLPAYALEVDVPQPALLVISDLYYPGWKVSLDYRAWKLFPTDYLFRAIIIPAGKHYIKFTYTPLPFIVGIIFFALTIGSLLIFSLINYLQNILSKMRFSS